MHYQSGGGGTTGSGIHCMSTACFHSLVCEFIIYDIDTGPESQISCLHKMQAARMTSSILHNHVRNKIKTGHRSMLSRTKQKERKKRRNTRLNGEQSEGDGHGYDMRRRENKSEDSNELSSKDPAAALNISSLLLTGHCQAVKHKTQRDKGGAPVVWSVSSVQASHAKRRKTVLAASVGWRTEENPKMSR